MSGPPISIVVTASRLSMNVTSPEILDLDLDLIDSLRVMIARFMRFVRRELA